MSQGTATLSAGSEVLQVHQWCGERDTHFLAVVQGRLADGPAPPNPSPCVGEFILADLRHRTRARPWSQSRNAAASDRGTLAAQALAAAGLEPQVVALIHLDRSSAPVWVEQVLDLPATEVAARVVLRSQTDLLWQCGGPYSGMRDKEDLKRVSDDALLRRLPEILRQSRRSEADLIAHLAEIDAQRLYARQSASSMFVYCTETLHLSEQEAYVRIAVARASREHPMLLAMLRDGRLHLSGIARLAPHLTPRNREEVLTRATHKSHRQIVELVAELEPRPAAPARIRKLPTRGTETPPASASQPGAVTEPHDARSKELCARRVQNPGGGMLLGGAGLPQKAAPMSRAHSARVQPLAPARYRVQFTASAELRDKL